VRAPWILLVVASLFLGGFVVNLVTGEATVGDSVAQFLIAGVAVASFLFVRKQAREREAFLGYLAGNLDAVRSGAARFRDEPLTYATRLREHELVLSFLIVSVRMPTRPAAHGSRAERALRAGCTLVTLIFGWWGVPWGPIWTVRALRRNLGSAGEVTVAELLEGRSTVQLPPSRVRRGRPR
jgi:hypothetical protein